MKSEATILAEKIRAIAETVRPASSLVWTIERKHG